MKLYIGNLPWSFDDEKLKEVFSKFGEIEEANVITDRNSGRSKGFGFVTFKNEASAKKAIEEMNEKEIEGRAIKVNEAKPMDPGAPRKPRRDFNSRGSFSNRRRF